jgi:hypothetical protein
MKEQARYVVAIAPAAIIDNASATATVVDTAGANYAEFIVQLGATDIAMTAFRLEESDVSGSGYTIVPNANFATGRDSDGVLLTLPSATDDNETMAFKGSLLGRKRFMRLVATFGDGTAGGFISGFARLSGLAVVPDVTTDLANGRVCVF